MLYHPGAAPISVDLVWGGGTWLGTVMAVLGVLAVALLVGLALRSRVHAVDPVDPWREDCADGSRAAA